MKKIILTLIVGLFTVGVFMFWKIKTEQSVGISERERQSQAPIIIKEGKITEEYEHARLPESEDKVFIQGRNNTKVEANNYLKNGTILNENGDLALTPAPDFYSTPDYGIDFYPNGAVFHINIYNGPVEDVRRAAEKKFLEILGISEQESCNLNVYVGVSKDVDIDYAGYNVGLTYCK